MANNTKEKPHAILFPYPLQGHIIPFVNLALKLASNGFTITFINTQSVHRQISQARNIGIDQDIFTEARESGLNIKYATVNDGFPVGFDRSLNHDQFMEGVLHVLSAHIDELVENLVKKDPTINCFISDTFYVWPLMIAEKYHLVNISFFTEPALILALNFHIHLLRKNGHFATSENRTDAIEYIPGIKSIMPRDLTSYLRAKENISTPVHRIIYKAFVDAQKADFMICNTIQELEQDTISALKKIQPFYSIGPIFPPGFKKGTTSSSMWAESDCTQWLNTKPNASVLYLSFGSYAHTSKEIIEEIAHGLLLSGVNFIWVLRPDIVSSDEVDFLPVGFEDQIKGRGLIVSWCTQLDVLSHPAVGGFITHCGWNSILESVWCGVPLICYPLLTDQFTNRKLAVDDLKIGVNLCDDESDVSREGVLKKINYLMNVETSGVIREEVKKVRKFLQDAMAMDGSSELHFNQFIKDLEAKIANVRGHAAGNGCSVNGFH